MKLLKVGSQCAITATPCDLRTETTESAASVRTSCEQDALFRGLEDLADRISR